jgi:hypothetical protein
MSLVALTREAPPPWHSRGDFRHISEKPMGAALAAAAGTTFEPARTPTRTAAIQPRRLRNSRDQNWDMVLLRIFVGEAAPGRL